MFKRFLFVAAILASTHLSLNAQDLRSDTIDILHTKIHLDITDFSGQSIGGYSELTCSPLQSSVQNLNVDLLKLNIDSVTMNGNALTTVYNDTLLRINLGQAFTSNDTFKVSIYYHGQPQKESWGGFRFTSDYAFNLGVGFTTDPHNYGRVWFPCFDNFVERSTFTFEIISADNRTSYCNGEMIDEVVLSGDTVMRTWVMNESIPSYLANVAVSDYAEVKWDFVGMNDTIPVLLAVNEADTSKIKASFAHLDEAMQSYESAYGPYRFNKVGYCVVPMGGGMEHASNISYSKNAVNGNLNSETLMAHELAHMWWGDLVTCDKQEEMWINEGMASFSEHVFLEDVYGRERYIEEVKANHIYCIQYLHITEEKYRAISGVPHEYTYSSHVYDKGAAMAHNLRGYMGDSLFFDGLTQFLDDHQFEDVNSYSLRDKLKQYSGLNNLDDFFDDWVFGPGYANFNIDSVIVTPSPGLNNVEVFIHQKKRGSDHFFSKVPITVSFYDDQFNEIHEEVEVSNEFSVFQFSLPILPEMVALNTDDALNLAVTADQVVVSSDGNYTFVNGKWNLDVNSIQDSMLLRVEHHWAAPDPGPTGYRMSDYRFWEIRGTEPQGFSADAYFNYDGRGNTSGGNGNLDNDLLINGPDSILLMYRASAAELWREYPFYKKVSFGSAPFGRMEMDSVLFGQYTFANGLSYLAVDEKKATEREMKISPNPSSDKLRVEDLGGSGNDLELMIFNTQGKKMWKQSFENYADVDTSSYRSGTYFAVVFEKGKQVWSGQFIVVR